MSRLYVIPRLDQKVLTSVGFFDGFSRRQLFHSQVNRAVSPLRPHESRSPTVHLPSTNGHHEQDGQKHPAQSEQPQTGDDALVQVGPQLSVVHLQFLHLPSRNRVRVDFGLAGDGVGDDHQDDAAHEEHQRKDEAVVRGVVVGRVVLVEIWAFILSHGVLIVVRDLLRLLLRLKADKGYKTANEKEMIINNLLAMAAFTSTDHNVLED